MPCVLYLSLMSIFDRKYSHLEGMRANWAENMMRVSKTTRGVRCLRHCLSHCLSHCCRSGVKMIIEGYTCVQRYLSRHMQGLKRTASFLVGAMCMWTAAVPYLLAEPIAGGLTCTQAKYSSNYMYRYVCTGAEMTIANGGIIKAEDSSISLQP